MAYTTPDSVSPGTVHTAARWNTQVRDNFAFFKGGPTIDGTTTLSAGVLLLPGGTAANPAFSFSTEQDVGVFLAAANRLGLAAGAVVYEVTTANIRPADDASRDLGEAARRWRNLRLSGEVAWPGGTSSPKLTLRDAGVATEHLDLSGAGTQSGEVRVYTNGNTRDLALMYRGAAEALIVLPAGDVRIINDLEIKGTTLTFTEGTSSPVLALRDDGLSTEHLDLEGPGASAGSIRVYTNNGTRDVSLLNRSGEALNVLPGGDVAVVNGLTVGGNTAAVVETGSYTGDGTNQRTISTPFEPKQVTVVSDDSDNWAQSVGTATNWQGVYRNVADATIGESDTKAKATIKAGGFEVTDDTVAAANSLNANTQVYRYTVLG